MQLFPCPFCGPRPENEFHHGGDLGNLRPEGCDAVSDRAWADYLYMTSNRRGETSEIWKHLTCQEVFTITRDTLTHAVKSSRALAAEEGQ